MPCREAVCTIFIIMVFGMTRLGHEPATYRMRGGQANHKPSRGGSRTLILSQAIGSDIHIFHRHVQYLPKNVFWHNIIYRKFQLVNFIIELHWTHTENTCSEGTGQKASESMIASCLTLPSLGIIPRPLPIQFHLSLVRTLHIYSNRANGVS